MTKMDLQLVRQHAADFCRYARNNDKRMVNSLIELYKESPKSPSIASAIIQNETKKSVKYLADVALEEASTGDTTALKTYFTKIKALYTNSSKIDTHPDVRPYYIEHAKSFQEKYPNSCHLRMALIQKDRINASTNRVTREINGQRVEIGEVTPKANWHEKIKFSKFFK